MLAISAYHRFGSEAALPYKINALRILSESLAAGSTQINHSAETMETQLAACMMLCMYSVHFPPERASLVGMQLIAPRI